MSASFYTENMSIIDVKQITLPDGQTIDLVAVECNHEDSNESVMSFIMKELRIELRDIQLYDDHSKHYGWRLYRIFK